ncbi:MAG TPA: redoxin domain-containing protein [Fimbriiglobus sp.]
MRTSSLLVLFALAPAVWAGDAPAPVGTQIANFTLPLAADGKLWVLADRTRDSKGTVVVFLAAGCPVSTAYVPRLSELYKKYSPKGITFVAVYSHPTDEPADIVKHGKDTALPFPAVRDADRAVARKFAVVRLPTVAFLDSTRTVRYAGRIDDQYSPNVARAKQGTSELASALSAYVDGQEIRVPYAPAAGCLLPKPKSTAPAAGGEEITFHKQVERIMQARCQGCHRPGQAGPFSLLTYKSAKGWSDMIQEVVTNGTMPPWHADAPLGHFKNDRRLSPDEKAMLLAWIERGCPEGNPADAPEPRPFVTGWRLPRTPELVLKMNKPITVPAQYLGGLIGMPYQYVLAGDPFPEDTWIEGVEVRPEYRAVVHHIIAFILPPGQTLHDLARETNFGELMLGAYVPGDQPTVLPKGYAKKIPKGCRVLFEMHYTPNGKAGKDRSMVGVLVSKTPPKHEVSSIAVMNHRFNIPPGAANYRVKSVQEFPEESVILSLTPHMHLRGKSFRFELVTPGPGGKETRQTLLNVPKYDFNWQVQYELAEPVTIPAGGRVECFATYDNSTGNPFNPDPAKRVRWGNQTYEEMMIGFVEYYRK